MILRRHTLAVAALLAGGLGGHALSAPSAGSAASTGSAAPATPAASSTGAPLKVLRHSFNSAETGFDPAKIVDLYSRTVSPHIFEGLYAYDHLARPFKIRPLTAAALPEVSPDFTAWTIRLKPGIYFAADPAFKGQRRELTAADYVYSYKRFADPANKSPLYPQIESAGFVGLHELREEAVRSKQPFDYDRPIEGLRATDRYTLQIRLKEPRPRLLELLAAGDLMGAVAREVVEHYGEDIMAHPVGTGPFRLAQWRRSSLIVLERNPDYRERFYDAEPAPDDVEGQRILARLKGRRLPMVDRVEVSIIEEAQPRWLAFLNGDMDFLNVPSEYIMQAVPGGRVAPNLAKKGIQLERSLNADGVYAYFNMDDPIVGGYTPDKVALRRALGLSLDVERIVRLLYRGQGIQAQSLLIPHTSGYDPKFKSEMGDYDPARAKALLDLYGYKDRDGDGFREMPDGRPLSVEIATQSSQFNRQFDELWKKNFEAVGVRVRFFAGQWPEQLKAALAGKLQMWTLGGSAASPDGQDTLASYYSREIGSNNLARFRNDEMDRIYTQAQQMADGPERDALFRRAKLIGNAFMPYKSLMHRFSNDLTYQHLVGYRRPLFWTEWWHMVDIDRSTPMMKTWPVAGWNPARTLSLSAGALAVGLAWTLALSAGAWAQTAAPAKAAEKPANKAEARASAQADTRAQAAAGKKILRVAFNTPETSFDPVQISDLYSRTITPHIFEGLYRYDHLARPAKIRPLTADGMPESSADFRTWTVKVKPGIYFADDPAFKGVKRELTARDYVYSILRTADPANRSELWTYIASFKIVGLSEKRKLHLDAKTPFDYESEPEGLRTLDRYTLQIRLTDPNPRFLGALASSDLLGAVAREVVEFYGDKIGEHPVGTGPFRLKSWRRSSQIVLERNPTYREMFYDEEPAADDADGQAILAQLKGKRLPIVDEVHVAVIDEDQPMWLSFLNAEVDALASKYGAVPANFVTQAMPNGKMAPNLAKRGIVGKQAVNSDIAITYFNMEDPVVGGYTPEKIALRRAISLAMDVEREIRTIRRGQAIPAQSNIVPFTTGYDPKFKSEAGDYDPARARALLDLYGYKDRDGDGFRELPDGKPLTIVRATQPEQIYRQYDELWRKNLMAIGIRTTFETGQWPEHLKKARAGKLQVWSLGSSAAGTDGQSALYRLHGPQSGSQNLARFKSAAFDAIYDRMSQLPDGPEREALFREAKIIAVAYAPYKPTVHRISTDVWYSWLIGYRRPPFWNEWWHLVDVDAQARAQALK